MIFPGNGDVTGSFVVGLSATFHTDIELHACLAKRYVFRNAQRELVIEISLRVPEHQVILLREPLGNRKRFGGSLGFTLAHEVAEISRSPPTEAVVAI